MQHTHTHSHSLNAYTVKPHTYTDHNGAIVEWKSECHRTGSRIELSWPRSVDWICEAQAFTTFHATPTRTPLVGHKMRLNNKPTKTYRQNQATNHLNKREIVQLAEV